MKERRLEYPCAKCKVIQPCQYMACHRYRMWFTQEWAIIREAARKIKEKQIRRTRW